jgi:hypothetical protein
MLALIVYTQLVQGDAAETSVKLNEQQLKDLRATVREAIDAAREANEDSGFWGSIGDALGGDIGSLAQVVAVAAACVATGGTAALVLGAIAIGCTLASKYADDLGIPPKVAIGIGIAAAVASVAAGNVGASASLAGAASSGAQIASSAGQASQLVQTALKVKFAADVVASSAQAGGAVAHLVSGYYAGSAVDHKADAQQAKAGSKLEAMAIDEAIAQLDAAIDRQLSAYESALDISAAKQQSDQRILLSFAGAA